MGTKDGPKGTPNGIHLYIRLDFLEICETTLNRYHVYDVVTLTSWRLPENSVRLRNFGPQVYRCNAVE